ncbi:ABC transporter ATP-binding protein [uncultured Amnibacterium sp.]|uniref:ABC transporter ATP-binding protein n=1 Tax=uncultured Amnibacterium sp. TaxID=1631851 RepID=UPI0035C9DF83
MSRGRLDARVAVQHGAFALDVALTVEPGTTVALVGRNGAGKSTLLNALAGLEPVQRGSIVLDDQVLDGGPGTESVSPERRPVGFVQQQVALFPHLSVLDNVAFGLRTAGRSRSSARTAARRALEHAGLDALAERRPAAVSGGQAARIALLRATVRRPALLLLDEPLAAIDAESRPAVRERIRADLADFDGSAIVVTHDVRDADALADQVVVLDAGRLLQMGTLAHLRAAPVDPVVTLLLKGQRQNGQTSRNSPAVSG